MKTRLLRFVFLVLLSVVFVTACRSMTTQTHLVPPLKIGYDSWSGNFPLAIAREKGFFAKQGVKVEMLYDKNLGPLRADFAVAKLDGMLMPLGDFILISAKNPNVRAVLIPDESAGGDVVVAQPNIQRLADLKGKRIGVLLGTFGELFVIKCLEANGLTTDDVSLVAVEGEKVPGQLKSNDIQAGHTWEPYISQAVRAGGQVLFTSKQVPGLITDVFVFQERVLRDRPEDVRAFIRAWFQAIDYWQANPQESKASIAKTFEIDPQSISLDGIKWLSSSDNLKFFNSDKVTANSLYQTAKLYNDFYIRTGSLSIPADVTQLLNPSFLQPSGKGS